MRWIADGYGIDVQRLARANRLRSDAQIAVGQRLVIPEGARIVHRVRRGETLSRIAARYRVRDSSIAHANRLGLSRVVRPGKRLVMPREATLPLPPGGSRVASSASTARAPAPDAATDRRLARARTQLDRAVAEYRGAHFQSALDRAREVESVLAPLSSVTAARGLSAHAAFVAGSALAALGENEQAKAAFTRVHARDPSFEPPKGWLSPRLEQLYLAARSEERSAGRGRPLPD